MNISPTELSLFITLLNYAPCILNYAVIHIMYHYYIQIKTTIFVTGSV